MINIISRRCNHPECTTQPYYGFPDDASATRCKAHADSGMIDIKNRRCNHSECTTHPCYGFPDDAIATRCKAHADSSMIDVLHRRCEHGTRLKYCTENNKTCGKRLSGRSKTEIYQTAMVYSCICAQTQTSADLNDYLGSIQLHYTPQDDSWLNDCGEENRIKSVINVDAIFGKIHTEYDGQYWHVHKLQTDTAKSTELLKAGMTVLRIRDRLPPLDIEHPQFISVDVDERSGHEVVAKKVAEQVFSNVVNSEGWPNIWKTAKSLAERAIESFMNTDQMRMTDFFTNDKQEFESQKDRSN